MIDILIKQHQNTKSQDKKDTFIQTAKRLDCDESEAAFDGKLKRIIKAAPKPMPKKKPSGK